MQEAYMEKSMEKKQNFQDLYGYFCGMLARGNMDELYGRALGAVPDLGSITGSINILKPSGTNTSDRTLGQMNKLRSDATGI
jgi:hypothetical protein